jgi:hypothetical protein
LKEEGRRKKEEGRRKREEGRETEFFKGIWFLSWERLKVFVKMTRSRSRYLFFPERGKFLCIIDKKSSLGKIK